MTGKKKSSAKTSVAETPVLPEMFPPDVTLAPATTELATSAAMPTVTADEVVEAKPESRYGIELVHTTDGLVVSTENLPLAVDPLLLSLSPLTFMQLLAAAERVRAHGQRAIKTIKTDKGDLLISGIEDYLACRFLKIDPELTKVATPEDLPFFILSEHVPRHVWKPQRAAMAALTVERYATIARAGKIEKLKARAEEKEVRTGSVRTPSDDEAVRATKMAARAAQIGREAVDQALAILRRSKGKKGSQDHEVTGANVLFRAMLDGSLRQMSWANRIFKHQALDSEDMREGAIRALSDGRSRHTKDLVTAFREYVRKITRPALGQGAAAATPERYQVLGGDLREVGATLPDRSFDRAFADPLWGTPENPETCEEIAKLWARVGKPGAIICFLPGVGDQIECVQRIAKHLTYMATGNYRLTGYTKPLPGFLDRMEDMPLWYFCVGKQPEVTLTGQSSTSNRPQAMLDVNQRDLSSVVTILENMKTLPGMKVLDPVCCTGTTLVAAMKLGCHGVGIEREAERVTIARGRCNHYETKGFDITEDPAATARTADGAGEASKAQKKKNKKKPKSG